MIGVIFNQIVFNVQVTILPQEKEKSMLDLLQLFSRKLGFEFRTIIQASNGHNIFVFKDTAYTVLPDLP